MDEYSEILKNRFISENPKLKIVNHPFENHFLIIKNLSFNDGSKLCEKYHASGLPAGVNFEHFMIGNFGKY